MAWIFVTLLVFFVGAAAFTAVIAPRSQSVRTFASAPPEVKSYVGVNGQQSEDTTGVLSSVWTLRMVS
jgi:hypothetical protein